MATLLEQVQRKLDAVANSPISRISRDGLERVTDDDDHHRNATKPGATWPTPTEIKSDLPPPPPFDAKGLLPAPLYEFVLDEAARMPCSPDYIAAAMIVSLGSVIGARCAIKPKRRDDWIVTPNLFGGVVGDPSSKKSPAISTAFRFVDRLEAKEAEKLGEREKVHEAEMAAFAARQSAITAAMKKAAAGKGDGLKMNAAVADLQSLDAPEKPQQRRFKTNDATVEKIGDLLTHNPGGLLVFRDELIGLLSSWDKEGREGDRAFYLEGWNGTGGFNIDRISRGSLFVPNLCLSVFGGIQPDLLERYLDGIVNALDNDGRIQRFQMLVYPEPVAWQWIDRYPVKGAREAMRDLFDRLADFDPVQDGATPADDFVKLPHFAFDDEAQEIFVEWDTELQTTLIPNEQNMLMRQHLAKFEKLFCSLALILHLAGGRIGRYGPIQRFGQRRGASTSPGTLGACMRCPRLPKSRPLDSWAGGCLTESCLIDSPHATLCARVGPGSPRRCRPRRRSRSCRNTAGCKAMSRTITRAGRRRATSSTRRCGGRYRDRLDRPSKNANSANGCHPYRQNRRNPPFVGFGGAYLGRL